jgi:glyoxylase-like metal-dependent hydrolase (beta-lactamase superfamily II)
MLVLDVQSAPARRDDLLARAGMDRARAGPACGRAAPSTLPTWSPPAVGFTRLVEGGTGFTSGGRDWTVRIGDGHAPEHATLWSDDGIW